MSLTSSEQLSIMSGVVSPPNFALLSLVHQTSFMFAKSFYDDYKEFAIVDANDLPINTAGDQYRSKMFSIANKVLRNDPLTTALLTRIVVVLLGEQAFTLAQINGADITAWEGFILSQMDEAFEYASGVKKDEKTEYLSL